MAGISMMQKLLDNALTSKFAKSLKHSDLPEGWADNPEIVQLAKEAYKQMGTKSPWFKAWNGGEGNSVNRVFRGLGEKYNEADTDLPFVWVTPSRELANSYAYNSAKKLALQNKENQGNLLSLYINSSRPFDFGFGGVVDTTPQEMRSRIVKAIVDSFTQGRISAEEGKRLINALKPLQVADDGLVKNWEVWDKYPEIKEALEGVGYDSLFALEGDVPTIGLFRSQSAKSTLNDGTFNPDDPNIYKGLIPAVGAGGMLALLGPEDAEASVPSEDYVFPADKRGTVLYEPGLESPIVDPADIITAPIGAVGAGAKAAAMAAEPFLAYGMDKAMDYISKWWSE